ncbi:hypothetical protein EWB00_004865 [Schistosoma japonicum]|uniref:Uncharacterized protein n=1 Tax=Schistosoma japonicum TaxID=6182 RepID=A0A4Z2D3X9_SCHJA|nr:hypothetical protein EWB00_004865 [Schistosoma japonicum]
MQSQQYNIEKQQIYYPKQNKHLLFNELCNHLSTTTTTTTNTVTTTSDDDDNNSSNMLKSLEKSNLYTSSDYISCPQFNLCINRTDYLFSDHNLNMGVVPPPNLNPFTSS